MKKSASGVHKIAPWYFSDIFLSFDDKGTENISDIISMQNNVQLMVLPQLPFHKCQADICAWIST